VRAWSLDERMLMHASFRPALLALAAGLAASAHAQVGTFVALPDTQFYSDSATRFPQFTQQTQWIKDNRSTYNIEFVSHLGDVVQNGSILTEWTRADQAMDILDTIIPELPYSLVPGNHDYNTTGSKSTLAANYVNNFGPARFAGKAWYGGATINGWNSYQLITIAGRQYLHLALEWLPASVVAGQDDAIAWAQGIIDLYPNMPTILSTHEYIIDDFSIASGRSGGGEAIWTGLVRSNNQIFLTLNGHFHRGVDGDDGERYEVATNNFGRPVHQLLSDYQAYPNGGDAFLRLYTFNEPANAIHVVSYSPKNGATNTAGGGLIRFNLPSVGSPYAMPAGLPSLTAGTVQVDANSRFDIPLDFSTRFVPPPPPPPPPPPAFVTVTFREGVSGYVGTQDTYLAFATPTTDRGTATVVQVDTVNGTPSGPEHGLLRFDNIIGTNAGQIDPGAIVDLALLNLNTTNSSTTATSAHRMVAPWTEAATWTSFTNGLQADGIEARVAADRTFTPSGSGAISIDVTNSLAWWLAGETNNGWAFLPAGSDGWAFTSSEGTTVSQRPQLTVRILAPGVQRATFENGVDGYNGNLDTELRQSTPTFNAGNDPAFSVDGDDPNGTGSDNHVLMQFQDIIGGGAGQVPAGPNVLINKAFLIIEGFDPGDGARLHRVLQPWDETVTWANSFGGNGVQATGIEAVALDDASTAGATGRVEIDVTASVQAWVDGEANHGWAFLPLGNNGWDIRSSEGTPRPQLRVYYSITGPSCDSLDFNNDGASFDPQDIDAFVSVFSEGPCIPDTATCNDIDFNNDGSLFDPCDIDSFLLLFSEGPCTTCG
jgi:hypothetical protein